MLVGLSIITSVSAQNYDLVINSGRVMGPETNYDQVANMPSSSALTEGWETKCSILNETEKNRG